MEPVDSSSYSPLLIRVMRLNSPQITTSFWDPIDVFVEDVLDPSQDRDLKQECSSPAMVLSEAMALQLPNQQGKVFAGEVFRAYVNLVNIGMSNLVDVKLHVSFSTPLQTDVVYDEKSPRQLCHQESHDITIQHPVITPGTHVLNCEVSYKKPQAGMTSDMKTMKALSIKRVFKFLVLEPFHLTYETVQLSTSSIILQCLCTNQTEVSVFLESIFLKEIPDTYDYLETDFGTPETPLKGFPHSTTLHNQDIISFLCTLAPKNNTVTLQTRRLGILEIVWRVRPGGKRVTRIPLELRALESKNIHNILFRITKCPQFVKTETPFNICIECSNMTSETISLQLNTLPLSSECIAYIGVANKKLPPLHADQQQTIDLTFIALRSGSCLVDHIQFNDALTKNTYNVPPFTVIAL